MQELLTVLPIILRRANYQEEVCQQAAFVAWDRAVGETISEHCTPFRLYDERLIVLTTNQIWKKQLQEMSSQIIFKIDRLLGAPIVKYIEYRVDAQQVAARRQEQKGVRFEHLEAWLKDLESDAEAIDDPELRRLFLRAASKYLARQQASNQ